MNKKHSAPTKEEIQKQMKKNYESFLEMSFKFNEKGKAALLHDGRLIATLDTKADAYKMGLSLYEYPGLFSIQEIDSYPVDLGFMSHALCSSRHN